MESGLNLFRDPAEWGRDPDAEKWPTQRAIFYNQQDIFGGESGRCEGWLSSARATPRCDSLRKYQPQRAESEPREYGNSKTQSTSPLLASDGCIDSKLITPPLSLSDSQLLDR